MHGFSVCFSQTDMGLGGWFGWWVRHFNFLFHSPPPPTPTTLTHTPATPYHHHTACLLPAPPSSHHLLHTHLSSHTPHTPPTLFPTSTTTPTHLVFLLGISVSLTLCSCRPRVEVGRMGVEVLPVPSPTYTTTHTYPHSYTPLHHCCLHTPAHTAYLHLPMVFCAASAPHSHVAACLYPPSPHTTTSHHLTLSTPTSTHHPSPTLLPATTSSTSSHFHLTRTFCTLFTPLHSSHPHTPSYTIYTSCTCLPFSCTALFFALPSLHLTPLPSFYCLLHYPLAPGLDSWVGSARNRTISAHLCTTTRYIFSACLCLRTYTPLALPYLCTPVFMYLLLLFYFLFLPHLLMDLRPAMVG